MSEFFKAATKCDVRMAREAPMYIDQTGVLEELYHHERLVEQTLKTKLLLDALDEEEAAAGGRKAIDAKDVDSIVGNGYTVEAGSYREPPMSIAAQAKAPEERNRGSRALHCAVESRMNIWKKELEMKSASVNYKEQNEKANAKLEEESRRRDAERELNALIATRQLTAHEAQKEARRIAAERAKMGDRVHPIDILQKRIAADLLDEIEEGTRFVTAQVEREEKGVDEIRDIESMKDIKYKYHSPSKHIPRPW
ncbi:Hypothetical protein, putative [Bodo saltans]|uniref:Uncharacterized protein n=1 Tax=Bodo saltans TaxID=75058 RepID=A0A0S4KIQ9_BODSA|nr:Hypothetical protein, putative [Bodo saltans]|eukprot:CUI15572.1 Hypothetical protein, putative [Bodo saltans]